MTLKKKIVGIIVVLMSLTAVMNFTIYRWVIFPHFKALERQQAEKDLSRCTAALKSEIDHLDAFTNDWAAWDDTYRFIADQNSAYIQIQDNGVGFDPMLAVPAVHREKGFGLFSIRERLNHLGGRMEVVTGIDAGTCVTLLCPVPEASTPPVNREADPNDYPDSGGG